MLGPYLATVGLGVIMVGFLVLVWTALPARRWLLSSEDPAQVTLAQLEAATSRWSVTPYARLPPLVPDYSGALFALLDPAGLVVLVDPRNPDAVVEETYFALRDASGRAVVFVRSKGFSTPGQALGQPTRPVSLTGILDRGPTALPPRLTAENPAFLEGTSVAEAWVLRAGETPPEPRAFLPALALGVLLFVAPMWPIGRYALRVLRRRTS